MPSTAKSEIYLHYQQAMALTVFLMQWHDGTYRDAFLDYVRDAYRGRIKHGAGRSLQDRLGQPYATLDSQFLASSRTAKTGCGAARRPWLSPAPNDAIRTVPRQ